MATTIELFETHDERCGVVVINTLPAAPYEVPPVMRTDLSEDLTFPDMRSALHWLADTWPAGVML